jgi:hypothetical protein
MASLLGALKIESLGTQNHRFTMSELRRRFEDDFQAALP